MIDQTTQRPIEVSLEGDAGPYIMVPVQQLADVRHILDAHQIGYWVDLNAIAIDGEPAVTVINLRRGVDPTPVQELLDAA